MIAQVNYLRKIWNLLLDILFPRICLNCRKYLGNDEIVICGECLRSIEINKIFFRTKNGLLLAAGSYENQALRELIHYFKFNRFLVIESVIGKILLDYLKTVALSLNNFLVVPVPLHKKRLRERGFNQSEIVARIAASFYHLPLEAEVIEKVRNTLSQIELKNYREREENVKGSFAIVSKAKSKIKDKNILIVDDVYTSGATINEVAKVLRKGGAKEIVALVLAKAG